MADETPTASQPLASGAQLEAFTKGRIKDGDAGVDDALAAASQAVRNACGWHIAPSVTETRKVDGRGASILPLPTLKLTAVTTLIEDGTPRTPDVDFEWSENGVLERHPRWARKRRGITVTITHGYDLDDVPTVTNLVLAVAARAVLAGRSAGVVREQAGTNSVELAKVGGSAAGVDLFDHERARLRPYMLPVRA